MCVNHRFFHIHEFTNHISHAGTEQIHSFRMHGLAMILALMIRIHIQGIPMIGLTAMEPGAPEKWQLHVIMVYAVPVWRTTRKLPVN